MSEAVPADVIDNLAHHLQAGQPPAAWDWKPLTTTHPAMRVLVDGRSWIVKKSCNDRKDEILSLLFDEYGVVHHQATRMGGGWIIMRDAGAYTLASLPRELYHPGLFSQLGRLAASALLVGMRDRKLGNIAVDLPAGSEPVLSHIDYEGAFRTGLVNRILRPQKYYRYLLTRLLFDVATRFGECDRPAAFSLLLDAFRTEWARLGPLRPSRRLQAQMLLSEKLILWSGGWSTEQASRLMQNAFADLLGRRAN